MKEKKVPMRRCVGCNESKPKRTLIRICTPQEGQVRIDLTGKAPGRGIYLCPDPQCFQLARKRKAIGRGLRTEITEEQLDQLFEELSGYAREDS